MIEYIARQTNNKRGVVAKALGKRSIEKQLSDAEVNHCLSFEQVSDEMIEQYNIPMGDFDTITDCKYTIPSYLECSYKEGYLLDDGGKTINKILWVERDNAPLFEMKEKSVKSYLAVLFFEFCNVLFH